MNKEIEKKYLVDTIKWQNYMIENNIQATKENMIIQGYILKEGNKELRVRIYGRIGSIAIKIRDENNKNSALEFEYEIPLTDAVKLFDERISSVFKIRHKISLVNGLTLEVDEYTKDNSGLVTAEIELPSLDTKIDLNDLPDFIVKELNESKYSNYNLSLKPYKLW